MKRIRPVLWLTLGLVVGAAGMALARQAGDRAAARNREVLVEMLKEKVDGKDRRLVVTELERGPGSASKPHRHPGPVVGYVLDGELEVQFGVRPLRVYRKGEAWYEPAGVLHKVSRNPSKTAPVRFLAVMLADKDARQLVIPEGE